MATQEECQQATLQVLERNMKSMAEKIFGDYGVHLLDIEGFPWTGSTDDRVLWFLKRAKPPADAKGGE